MVAIYNPAGCGQEKILVFEFNDPQNASGNVFALVKWDGGQSTSFDRHFDVTGLARPLMRGVS